LESALLTGVAAFAATNLDDLFLLTAFFADRAYRARSVVAGQYAGIGLLYGASLAAALAAVVVPEGYVRLLGVLPVAIGLKRLFAGAEESQDLPHTGAALSVAAVTLANGADNIAVYVPLFAVRPRAELAVIGVVFALMTALWCWGAYRLVTHPHWGHAIRTRGHRLVPWALIALGAGILLGVL
jgi:cadmium resistance protein CadD (predicted permease)